MYQSFSSLSVNEFYFHETLYLPSSAHENSSHIKVCRKFSRNKLYNLYKNRKKYPFKSGISGNTKK